MQTATAHTVDLYACKVHVSVWHVQTATVRTVDLYTCKVHVSVRHVQTIQINGDNLQENACA